MTSIKNKTISGLSWSFFENSIRMVSTFVVGIILARLISPREFGLIGMMMVFIAVGNIFVSSGFSKALIRKQDCTQTDYSTVFIFNLLIRIIVYFIIFAFSGLISDFFNEPELKLMIKVLAFGIIINGISIIQLTQVTRELDFKLLAKISIIASVVSSIVSIFFAYKNFGAWSIIIKTLLDYFITTILLWRWNKWFPSFIFDKNSFKELFGFGSKLLFVSLLDTVYRNIYTLIVGKFFSARELGFYSRADSFKALPSENISAILQNVSYPILSKLQNNSDELLSKFKTILTSTMLITSLLIFGMAACSEAMVLSLIGPEWKPSIVYLQLLCFVGFMYPIHALNLVLLNVLGRSDLFLKLEIIKKIFAIPTIIIGVLFGITPMIIAMIFQSIVSYYINCYYTGKLLNYGILKQIGDLFKPILFSLSIATIVYLVGVFFQLTPWVVFAIQINIGIIFTVLIGEIFRPKDYYFIRGIVLERINIRKN